MPLIFVVCLYILYRIIRYLIVSILTYYQNRVREIIGYTGKKTNEYIYCLYIPFASLKVGKSELLIRRFQNHRTALRKLRIVGIIPVSNCMESETRFRELYPRVCSTEHYDFDIRIFLFIKLASDPAITKQIKQQFKDTR